MFSAPDQLLESMPGTLMLTDCLEACQANESCGAVNYETGLCVLFSANSDKLPGNKTINFIINYSNHFIISVQTANGIDCTDVKSPLNTYDKLHIWIVSKTKAL